MISIAGFNKQSIIIGGRMTSTPGFNKCIIIGGQMKSIPGLNKCIIIGAG